MKFGTATSIALHTALISWGLVNLSSPEIEQIELNSVEIDFETSAESQPVLGDRKADVAEIPAPVPTRRPEEEPDARNIGDAAVDDISETQAPPADRVIEKTATAPEPDEAINKPDDVSKVSSQEQPTPATELASLNDPATEIKEHLPAEQPATAQPTLSEQQIAALPEILPIPVKKPAPPKPNTAKTQERKQPEDDPAKNAKDAKKDDEQVLNDLIRNSKTTEDAASGGAKRSSRQAALGTSTSSFARQLSRREEDQLISRISRCSVGQAGQSISPDLKVTIILELNSDGTFKISPKGKATGGSAQERNRFTRDALRYSLRCAPYDFLPNDKYETWKQIVVTFHPSKMFE